jgi:hypothetical protein
MAPHSGLYQELGLKRFENSFLEKSNELEIEESWKMGCYYRSI